MFFNGFTCEREEGDILCSTVLFRIWPIQIRCREHYGRCSAPYSNRSCVNGVVNCSDCPSSGTMDQADKEVYKSIDELNGELAGDVLDRATVIIREVRGQIEP